VLDYVEIALIRHSCEEDILKPNPVSH